MDEIKKPTVRKKKKVYPSSNFFSTTFTKKGNVITIELPTKVAKYLELKDGQPVFWAPVNNTIQISANEPRITIPMSGMTVEGFIPQN
jgi:hypothetical protein